MLLLLDSVLAVAAAAAAAARRRRGFMPRQLDSVLAAQLPGEYSKRVRNVSEFVF
jgi:hypothetical protein